MQVLQEIVRTIPKPRNLVIPVDPNNIWLFFKIIKILIAAVFEEISREKSLKLFLHIPIYDETLRFNLYNVLNIPTFNANLMAFTTKIYQNPSPSRLIEKNF